MKHKIIFPLSILIVFLFISCKKYLDRKPDKALVVPSSVNDLQALLDHADLMNGQYAVSFDECSADDYYLPIDVYNERDQENRNTYIWQNTSYNNYPNDWSYIYNIVNVANVVLDNISTINANPQNQAAWNNVKGSALFYRAYSFLQGAFIFCKAYDESSASGDLGMALRLTSDFNLPSTRSALKDTYKRITDDLKEAAALLPGLPQHVLRPSKSATFALLARTYLSMSSYDSCLKYATLALQLKSDLIDYNTLNADAAFPFSRFNKEVYFDNRIVQPNYVNSSRYYGRVDTILYNSYTEYDIRKAAFFQVEFPGYSFKGSYQRTYPFVGLATDEVYLMQAECFARLGNKDAALAGLNTLMKTRWKDGFFTPFIASTPGEALSIILTERRKQLIFRNLRWMDIKRLNKEGANITLTRIINGHTYTLPPNDNRFALALPAVIINMTGMPQNLY